MDKRTQCLIRASVRATDYLYNQVIWHNDSTSARETVRRYLLRENYRNNLTETEIEVILTYVESICKLNVFMGMLTS